MFAILIIPAMLLYQTIAQSDQCNQGRTACLNAYSLSLNQTCGSLRATPVTSGSSILDVIQQQECSCPAAKTYKDW